MNAKRNRIDECKERYCKWIQRDIWQMDAKRDIVNMYKERYGRWMQREIW